jgi:putative polyketide hydroxylase
VAVSLNGRELSTIDLYGRRFVLLAGADGAAWVAAAERVGRRLEVPLEAYRFGVELGGAEAAAAHGIGPDGALLVRPDGFVAWRAEAEDGQPEGVLEEALAGVLGRAPRA